MKASGEVVAANSSVASFDGKVSFEWGEGGAERGQFRLQNALFYCPIPAFMYYVIRR